MTRTSAVQLAGWRSLELRDWRRASILGTGRPRYSYESHGFALGAFSEQGDPLWSQTDWTERHHIVFPTSSVAISLMSEGPFLTGPNHVVLYNPGDRYKRQLISGEDDRSFVMAVRAERLQERAGLALVGQGAAIRFRVRLVPLSARAHLVRWALFRCLAVAPEPPPELFEEACCFILDEVLEAAQNTRTVTARHAAVDEAKALLLRSFAEPLTLDRIAKELFVSPFHLARLFKADTGYTLHGYLTQLRLRRALELLGDARLDVNEIRAQVGFTTHSHFTESFRKAFGVTPSFVRSVDAARLRALLILDDQRETN